MAASQESLLSADREVNCFCLNFLMCKMGIELVLLLRAPEGHLDPCEQCLETVWHTGSVIDVLCPTTTMVVNVTVAVALAHSLRTWGSFGSKGNSCSTLNSQCLHGKQEVQVRLRIEVT